MDDAADALREIANDIERQRPLMDRAVLLMRRATSAAPWDWQEEMPDRMEFFRAMRDMQTLLKEIESL